MSANRIFLVCSHHKSPEDALLIAERAPQTPFYEAANMRRAQEWFNDHALCGKPDDFQVAFGHPQNHDVIEHPSVKPVAAGVKLGIINGSKSE